MHILPSSNGQLLKTITICDKKLLNYKLNFFIYVSSKDKADSMICKVHKRRLYDTVVDSPLLALPLAIMYRQGNANSIVILCFITRMILYVCSTETDT